MKAIVSLSGGMDSTTVLGVAVRRHPGDVLAAGFVYPSKHNRHEQEAAEKAAAHYGVPFRRVDLSGVFAGFRSDLLLTGGAVPEGHYEAESMKATVVPFRNGIFLAVLVGLAESLEAEEVWAGQHAGDHHIYPDCRPPFVAAFKAATEQGTDGNVTLVTPFLFQTKADILRLGLDFDVPYHLTRTCYTDGPVACGRCGACQERLEAFRLNGAEDPLEYQTREVLPKI